MVTLKEACLNVIVEEFETFHCIVSVSRNEALKRNFEFLQRKCSVELMSKLSQKNKLEEKYLNFLLNVYLKTLDATWFTNSHIRDSVEDIIVSLPNLTKIHLYDVCTDQMLEKIAEFCSQIVVIDASYSSITDTGLKYLCQNENGKIPCPELKQLYIQSTSVTDEGLISLIQNIPSLEEIHHGNVPKALYSIHKENMHNPEKVPTYNLVQLDLFKHSDLPYYSDLLKICLTVCPKLKEISCYITEKKQLNFFNNASLETLNIRVPRLKEKIDINNFLRNNGSNLISLDIYNCKLSVNVLVTNCPKLQDLCIGDSILLDDPDGSQLIFHHLTECTLTSTTIDKATNKAVYLLLSSSPNLKCLDFNICELTPEMKTCILKCCENSMLKYIGFYRVEVDLKFVKDILLSSPSLKTLCLQCCNYFFDEMMELIEIVKVLPNKPEIYVDDEYFINENNYESSRQ